MDKNKKIKAIVKTIEVIDVFSIGETGLDSPIYNIFGKDHIQLIEYISFDGVVIATYVHETVVSDDKFVAYKDLSDELLDEVYNIICNDLK